MTATLAAPHRRSRQMHATTRLGLVLAAAFVVACNTEPSPAASVEPVDTGGIRTFLLARESDLRLSLCNLALAARPVTGTFEGDESSSPDRAWVRDPTGRKLSIVWPQGFKLRFGQDAILLDELDRVVVRQGETVTFGQVNREDHAGTFHDPYFAGGIVFNGCYPLPAKPVIVSLPSPSA